MTKTLYDRITLWSPDRCLTDGENFAICPDCGNEHMCVFCHDECSDCKSAIFA